MALTLDITAADGVVSRIGLQPGRNRFSVRVGDTFRILDDQTGLTPEGIAVKRIDNSLLVDGLPAGPDAPTEVEFAEFYTLCSAASPCQLQVQPQAGSDGVMITPGSPPIGALADGAFVLYDPSFVTPEPVASSSAYDIRTVMYAVGGLAIAGLALGGGGGGGGDGGGPANPVGGLGGEPAPGPVLKLTSPPFVNSHTPTLTGEGEPGARVLVRIDTDGDGSPNVTYATTIGADFRWSIDLAKAIPESGALPAGGLPDVSIVGITSNSTDGIVSLPTFQLTYDGTPPAPAVVFAVATDNVVNASERDAGVTVSGTAEPNGKVLVTWGAQSALVVVDAAGNWQAGFATATLPADGNYVVTAVAQDQAGNRAAPTQTMVAVDTAPPALGVAAVAGDNSVSIAEAGKVGFSGNSDPGTSIALQWNNLSKVAVAGAAGQWTIAFAESEVPMSPGASFDYSIVATNGVGNAVGAAGTVFVDREAPIAPVIAVIEGDNIVTVAERSDGVTVNGSSEAGARVDVAWGNASRQVTADGNGNWTAGFASGDLPAVGSPGANSTVTAVATDGVGNTGATATAVVYLQQPFPPPTIAVVAGNDAVNLAERNGGIALSGNVQAGAPGVVVSWGAFSGNATLGNGTWKITVPADQVPGDGVYSVIAAIAGSPTIAASRQVTIDATPPAAPGFAPVEGDNIVSVAERVDGVPISGTAEVGSTVRVTWNGIDKTATTGANGAWSVDYAAGEVPTVGTGGGNTTVSARAVDGAGNTGSTGTHAVFVEQPFPGPTINVVEGNDVVNLVESSDGVLLSGSVQAGTPGVTVNWGGFTGAAAVIGASWSLSVPAGQVPTDGVAVVVATIAGTGGGASSQRPVVIDTQGPAQPVVDLVTGDDRISILEVQSVVLSGTAEAGSIVNVSLGSHDSTAIAGANGAWSIAPFSIFGTPPGTVILAAQATDTAGNPGAISTRSIVIEDLMFAIAPPAVFSAADMETGFLGNAAPASAFASMDTLLTMDDPARHLA